MTPLSEAKDRAKSHHRGDEIRFGVVGHIVPFGLGLRSTV